MFIECSLLKLLVCVAVFVHVFLLLFLLFIQVAFQLKKKCRKMSSSNGSGRSLTQKMPKIWIFTYKWEEYEKKWKKKSWKRKLCLLWTIHKNQLLRKTLDVLLKPKLYKYFVSALHCLTYCKWASFSNIDKNAW